MENLGAMADSRYTGFREITDRDVLELHCIPLIPLCQNCYNGSALLNKMVARAKNRKKKKTTFKGQDK